MSVKLSLIIPCFNEEKRFQKGFDHHFSYLKKQKYPWELILINDGSKDKTLRLMRESAKLDKNIKIISYKNNGGKGYAIVQGVKNAKGDYILFSDLDHSVPIKTAATFFKYFKKGNDLVIGSRQVKGAKLVVRQPKIRELLGKGFTILVQLIIDPKIKDSTCGFKAFKKETAKEIFEKITIYDWAFDAEIIFLCKKLGKKYAQAPVEWSDKGGSQVRLRKDVLRSLLGLFKIRLNDYKKVYG